MNVKRAVLSVADKTGIVELAAGLAALGVEVISTGGTAAALRAANVPVTALADVTGFPEILDGRVKTLHPAVHGALLAVRGNAAHDRDLARHGIRPIDLVAVTLYPFEAARARGADRSAMIEEIDIGGVTLLRAAAKNADGVTVLSDPGQYGPVLEELRRTGAIGDETRRRLAAAAFARTSAYDAAIASYLGGDAFPDRLVLGFEKVQDCRYGENPHQRGAFYREPGTRGPSVATARQLGGKELSYNNIYDLDAALELVREFDEPAAVVVKHGIPCGVGTGEALRTAYVHAREGDPISAFGGIVACDAPIDAGAAALLQPRFLEVVAAPRFEPAAFESLTKKKNLRLLEFERDLPARLLSSAKVRSALGGVLLEYPDPAAAPDEWHVVTERRPTREQWRDLLFAFGAVRQVKSNAAVVASNEVTLGVCGGQTNRVAAVELACQRAGAAVRGAVLATDGFFPFADGIEAAARAGIAAVAAPSGSIRDEEVIAAARKAGIALVFTSRRYFLH